MGDRMAITLPKGRREVIPVVVSIVLAILLIVSVSITISENEQNAKLKQQSNDLETQLESLKTMLNSSNVTTEQLQEKIYTIESELGQVQYELNYTQTRLQDFLNFNSTIPFGGVGGSDSIPFYGTSTIDSYWSGYLVVNVSTSSSNATLNINWDVPGYHYFTSDVVGYHGVIYALLLLSTVQFTVGSVISYSWNATLYS